MAILGPELLRFAIGVSLLLTILSLALLVTITVIRARADRRVRRMAHLRRRITPLLADVATGRRRADEVTPVLQQHAPGEALELLMELSERLEPPVRVNLRPLFDALPVRAELRDALGSRNWESRLRAAEQIGYFGDPGEMDALIAALRDDVLVVRLAAARSLVTLRSADAVEPILVAFDLPAEMNERRTAEILHAAGPAALGPLLAVLHRHDGAYSANVLNVAARVLGMLRAPEAVMPLALLLDHSDFRVRLNAARSLGAIGDRVALPDVARLTADPVWEVRNVAMQVVGKLGGKSEIPRLAAGLSDEVWWVRFSAAQALFSLGHPGVTALRQAASGGSDRYAREMSQQVLDEHGSLPAGAA